MGVKESPAPLSPGLFVLGAEVPTIRLETGNQIAKAARTALTQGLGYPTLLWLGWWEIGIFVERQAVPNAFYRIRSSSTPTKQGLVVR